MSHPIPFTVRADDLLRHLQDLRSGTYEGAMSRGAKEVVYRQDINLLRSVAEDKAMEGMDAVEFQTFYQENLGLIYRFVSSKVDNRKDAEDMPWQVLLTAIGS